MFVLYAFNFIFSTHFFGLYAFYLIKENKDDWMWQKFYQIWVGHFQFEQTKTVKTIVALVNMNIGVQIYLLESRPKIWRQLPRSKLAQQALNISYHKTIAAKQPTPGFYPEPKSFIFLIKKKNGTSHTLE